VVLITFCYAGILLTAAVIGMAAGLGVVMAKNRGNRDCSSPTCVDLSDQILSRLDQSINPCDDFYAFACNGFIANTIIPYGKFF
jgi:hypothetical protein